jgi:XTP/dITP diphosphohydrolase
MEILVATRNRHKVDEISQMLKGHKVSSLLDYPEIPDVRETGKTFFENALLKAKAIHKRLGLPVLADDSGLCVSALKGKPGVKSARYAGPKGTQDQIIRKLLRNMEGKKNRQAQFVTTMVFIDSKGKVHRSTGKVSGQITKERKGTNGFGYDPIFYYRPFGRTFAELKNREKNAISHRARALKGILPKIWKSLKK